MDGPNCCKTRVGEIQLLSAVALFGIGFVFQRVVAEKSDSPDGLKPLTYNALRYSWSSVLLLAAFPFYKKIDSKGWSGLSDYLNGEKNMTVFGWLVGEVGSPRYYAWYYGIICGITTFAASAMQQIGLLHSSVAKVAFITSLYVIAVPICESFLPGGHMSLSTWSAAGVSIVGTYLVSGLAEPAHVASSSDGSPHMAHVALLSELFVFIGTIFWTICIIFMDRGCRHSNAVLLTLIEFAVCAVLSFIAAAIFEPQELVYPFSSISDNFEEILWVGVTETTAFVLCSLGQTTVPSSRAALLMSFESLAGALSGFLFLNELLTAVELVGCVLISLSFFISAVEWTVDDVRLLLTRWGLHARGSGLVSGNKNRSSDSLTSSAEIELPQVDDDKVISSLSASYHSSDSSEEDHPLI